MNKQDWTYKKLGEVATIVGGSTPKSNIEDYWGGTNYWVTPADLNGNKYQGATPRTITDLAIQKTNLQLLPIGTVLLSSRAPIGKVAITTVPMYCNQGFKNIVCSHLLLNEFVYWYLFGKVDYLNSLGRGATFKEISKKATEQIPIPVPPIGEQERIVAELDLLSGIIEKKKEQLKAYDQLAQSIFYTMFGDPIDNPKGWETKKMEDCFIIGSGGTPSKAVPDYWEGGDIPWIGSNMCQNCIIEKTDGKFITEDGLNHSSAKMVESGTVLVALVGATIGKVALLKTNTAINQNIAFIKLKKPKSFIPEFVYYHLMGQYDEFMNIGDGKFKMANQAFIKSLSVCIPPLSLQQEFAEKMAAIERQKELVQQSIEETQTMFDCTMDKYFG